MSEFLEDSCVRPAGDHPAPGVSSVELIGRPRPGPSTFAISASVFLRSLGVVYLAAFWSLWTQVLGLIGAGGMLPIADYLPAVLRQAGPQAYWFLPTVCWLNASDVCLQALCGAGVALSCCVIAGVLQAPALIGLWGLFLSLTVACRVFCGFQWDALLLEVGLLAALLAPWGWRQPWRQAVEPSAWVRWCLWLVLFRLTFSSGMVKLLSGDETWRQLTALTHHYQTQPIPTWTSWYAHQLPAMWHRASCFLTLMIELFAPFMIFLPRAARHAGAWTMIGLQLLILATGNYAYFNWLTIALCVLLVDDAAWPRRVREAVLMSSGASRPGRCPGWIVKPVCALLLALSLVPLSRVLPLPIVPPLGAVYEALSPFRLVNGYGLFAVMTTRRPEIIVEGSDDGRDWRSYEFKHKPGDVARRPGFVAPFQPRLDWQMWFAALGRYQDNPWFLRFCERLLEGSPAVLALLANNPFPDEPPRYVRASLYDYRLTTPAERAATGAWWARERLGLYAPVMKLNAAEE